MATIDPFGLEPADAVKWFREKGYRLGFDWRDTWRDEHSWSFTVAKAMQLDILADLRGAVDDALTNGTTFNEFVKNLRPTLQAKGWWGEKEEVDPLTGETKVVKLGSPRRLRIIYDTNLRQAHSAGAWQRIQRLKERRPYLRYIARNGGNRRPEHQALHDLCLPVDHPKWDVIMPMNGWGCACATQQLSLRDVKALGLQVAEDVELDYVTYENKRTGEVSRIPKGFSPGFDYNPGKARGFNPAPGAPPLPVLSPVNTFKDYERPSMKDVPQSALREPPPLLSGRKDVGAKEMRREFREAFGIQERGAATLTDPLGTRMRVDESLLNYVMRNKGRDRDRYLLHAKAAVEDPYEIWMVPHRAKDGSVVMRRRYISAFRGSDPGTGQLVVVEHDLLYNTYPRERIDSQREGYLLWSRD